MRESSCSLSASREKNGWSLLSHSHGTSRCGSVIYTEIILTALAHIPHFIRSRRIQNVMSVHICLFLITFKMSSRIIIKSAMNIIHLDVI